MKTEESNFKRFGLVGRKIGYSFSPAYFKEKFSTEKIDASYKIFELNQIQQFPQLFLTKNLAGLNVTTPYKEEIMIFMDSLSPEAKAIGAVNTVKFKGDHLIGHNTDYIGFKNSLEPLLNDKHTKALILGTGGATKAVKYALELLNIEFHTVSRESKKADFTYNDLTPEIIEDHSIIINATPLGTFPNVNQAPDIPYDGITNRHLAYDLVYNPEKSLFLTKAEAQKAQIKNGYEMLKIQADESWKIWNSK